MFKDVDVDSLVKMDFDGATILGSKYVAPPIPNYEGVVEEGLKVYKGNCHCGAVTYALKSKPLDELEIMSCNCSLCSRVRHLFDRFPANVNINCRIAIYLSILFPIPYRCTAGKTWLSTFSSHQCTASATNAAILC